MGLHSINELKFSNNGGECFINSAFQILFRLDKLWSKLELCNNQLIKDTCQLRNNAISGTLPVSTKKCVDSYSNALGYPKKRGIKWIQQPTVISDHDANAFLADFLATIAQEADKELAQPVSSLFSFETCWEEKATNSIFLESISEILWECQGNNIPKTSQDAIDRSLSDRNLPPPSAKKQWRHFTLHGITKYPEYFRIVIPRASESNTEQHQVITNRLEIQDNVHLDSVRYNLIGAIIHEGNDSVSSGHYVAMHYLNDQFYYASDASSWELKSKEEAHQIMASSSTCLMYQKQ